MDKMRMESIDMTAQNIEKIGALFPNCITEMLDEENSTPEHKVYKKGINFELLRQMLSGDVIEGDEAYEFTWVGKKAAIVEANKPIRKTLRPCKEESVNWDSTENLYIEGDNLEVLKLLQESYLGKVKMIYIDPPYNTGNDFIYRDDFAMKSEEWSAESGEIDDEGNRLFKNTDTNGRFHSDWCSMIYSRLLLARNLLAEDGALFIHIDEHEVYSLTMICNEIFGEQNQLGTIIWDKRNPKGVVAGVAYQHESIIVYCKNIAIFAGVPFLKKKENAEAMVKKVEALIKQYGCVNEDVRLKYREFLKQNKSVLTGGELAYSLIDDDGNIYRTVSMAAPDKPETRSHRPLIHPVTGKPCAVSAKGWRFTDKTMDEMLAKGKIEFGKDETTVPNQKYFLKENMEEAVASLLYFGGSDDAMGLPFDNPKPVTVARKLINTLCKSGDEIIMDFFSGSATTAHAVMQLNAEDGGHRKFIMVQLPEKCDEASEAYKAGYKNICEIGKERIRRAGDQILEKIGIREQGIGSSSLSEKKIGGTDGDQLSGIACLAKVNAGSQGNLFAGEKTSQRGNVQPVGSNAAGGGVDSVEHCGGECPAVEKRICSVLEHSERLESGTGNAIDSLRGNRLPSKTGCSENAGGLVGNRENAIIDHQKANPSSLVPNPLDVGFRVLKLDDTNMKDVYYAPADYEQNVLDLLESNIKEDRTDLDLLFGCLLEWGLPLSLPYSSENIEGCTVHNYNDGDLIACFDDNIPDSVIKTIAKRQPLRAVFRDSSFQSSPAKINVTQIFKELAPDTSVKVL